LSGTTQVSRYQKGKTNLDFTEARDSEWQWHQLDRMQICTSLQTNNHASTSPLSFLQAGCPSCHPTNSVKALKTTANFKIHIKRSKHFQVYFKYVLLDFLIITGMNVSQKQAVERCPYYQFHKVVQRH